MALTKITKINTKVNVVEGLETRPQLPPQTLKQKFDEDSVNLKADVNGIVDGVNAVIDELTSINGARNIGTAKVDGVVGENVQDVMQGLIPKTDIVQALGSAADKIMSQKAVTDAIGQKGGGDMLKAVYDTTNNGVADDAEKLGNQPPAYYAKKTEVDAAVSDLGGIKFGWGNKWEIVPTDTTQQVFDKMPEKAMWMGTLSSTGGEYGTPTAGTEYGMVVLWKYGTRYNGLCNGISNQYIIRPSSVVGWCAI